MAKNTSNKTRHESVIIVRGRVHTKNQVQRDNQLSDLMKKFKKGVLSLAEVGQIDAQSKPKVVS
ncbi:MAG: hypothetical protein NTZ74_05510 [Chloroflexi bacterium]|nr:hypothetical protein [Chloroflexota bacterium]